MQLRRGAIIHFFDKTTSPPKDKFMVVAGLDQEEVSLATVFINSQLNTQVLSPELQALNIAIYPHHYTFLNKESFINCASITIRAISEMQELFDCNAVKLFGELNENDLTLVLQKLRENKEYKGKIKKKFGFYN